MTDPVPAHSWLSNDDRLLRYASDHATVCGLRLRCVDVGERDGHNGTAVALPGGRSLILYRGGGRWPGTQLRYVVLPAEGVPVARDAGLAGKNEDPRTIVHDGRLLVTVAHYDGYGTRVELYDASWPDDAGRVRFERRRRFETIADWPGYASPRFEKNWAPFLHDGRLYYVHSIRPHRVLEANVHAGTVRLAFETGGDAVVCHGLADPDTDMRLNAPPVRLADGRFLSTYHVGRHVGPQFDYYTGFYTFADTPPFAPLASTGPLLLPEDAEGFIPHDNRPTRCVFVTGMTVDNAEDRITLWGGDTDRRVITATIRLSRVLGELR